MHNEQTLSTLNALRLLGMAKGFQNYLERPQSLEPAELVGLLSQQEKGYRDNQRLARLLKNARLRQEAALENIDFRHARGLTKTSVLALNDTQWLTHHHAVLITGPTGIGKSYLACALGNLAARSGFTVLYLRTPRLFEMLHHAKADGSHLKMLTRLAKIQCLILDDFLLTPLTEAERRDLFEIFEDRYQTAATIVTSQLPIKDWHAHIGDPTLADAICDRLLHQAYKFELKGESLRKNK